MSRARLSRLEGRWFVAWMCLVVALLGGCGEVKPPRPEAKTQSAALPSDEELKRQLDEVIDFTYRKRHLNTDDHAAWQILHGALAFGRQFKVRLGRDGELVSAVDHILDGGYMKGWIARPGVQFDGDRRGLKAILETGSKTGQGHDDQWLAVLAQCDLASDQTIRVGNQTYTMEDFVRQVLWDVPGNSEWSWTLIGLTTYLPMDQEWSASDGQTWSIERLVKREAEEDINNSACGGTHRLIGLAMALNEHRKQGGETTQVWQQAEERIQDAVDMARRFREDSTGAFSTNYFRGEGSSPDLAQILATTGHTLELLSLSLSDEQLHEPWVKRAALHLCDVFRKTRDVNLECGALYHATHGLVLYRERVFGKRSFSSSPKGRKSPAGGGAVPGDAS